jgi:GNAT acetyltransferase-like protein
MSISTMVRHKASWSLETRMPHDWAELVCAQGGGFFHTPLGVRAGAPAGEPLYARFRHNGKVCGIAVGVRSACRMSDRARHVYFPAWPALADPGLRRLGMSSLGSALREEGYAEVRWDSFDAACTTAPATVPTRWEYVIDLPAIAESERWPESSHHRRSVRRGDTAGWVFRTAAGEEAASALGRVMETVTTRAAARGTRIAATIPPIVTDAPDTTAPWAATTYLACAGERLLAAVLVGSSATRAYYLMGGATPEGYAEGASAWLHAHVASRFADAGLMQYNMGGASLRAPLDGDPGHGLHRFKVGFGAGLVP